jgi:F-type H+-transporting ATPase subunit alpha
MEEAVTAFKKQFKSSAAQAINEAPAEALDGEGSIASSHRQDVE